MRLTLSISMLILVSCASETRVAEASGPIELPVIATGNFVALEPYVEEGKITVFDFYADWCPPCIKLDETLVDMKRTYGDRLVIYKLDLVDWDSNLAEAFGIKDLPYMIVYGTDKQVLHDGPTNQYLTELVKLLNRSRS